MAVRTGPAALCVVLAGCIHYQIRSGGDYYTSDLVNAKITVGPVAEARSYSRDCLVNRKIALPTEEIQREFAEGLAEIHRSATIARLAGKGGADRALVAARQKGSDLLIVPRIERLTIDNMGRNGLEPVAQITDALLFPISLAVALFTGGEKAGLGHQYVPIEDVMVSMRMTLEFYRVSDGMRLARRTYPTFVDVKTNKDRLEGAKLDPTDDMRDEGQKYGKFTVREFGRRIAKQEVVEFSTKVTGDAY
jgi:hypothetical protein